MNIGDTTEEAQASFSDYISKYYPELSQMMDLSNWGPVGTPDDIAAWIREFAGRGVDHFICRFGAIDQFAPGRALRQRGTAAVRRGKGWVRLMADENGLRKEAELIIDTCFSVEEDDVVTIIHDDSRVEEAADAGRGRRRPRRLAGADEQRDPGASRPGRHALPDDPAAQPPQRDDELGRDHHRHEPGVGEPLRARAGRQGVMREQRQDRLRRAWDGRVGPDARPDRCRDAAGARRDGRARGRRRRCA